MKRLRKLTSLTIIFTVLFAFRVAWSESSKLGLTSGSLSQASVYSSFGDQTQRSLATSLGLIFKEDSLIEQDVLQTKANLENGKLYKSFQLLKSTSSGESIANYLDKTQVKVTFGKPKTLGAAAVFVPNFVGEGGTIIISERLREEQPSVLAAILAHEATHAKMDSILDYDSVEQEYKCYIAQGKVWEEVRSGLKISAGEFQTEIAESNPENDYAIEIMKMDKSEALEQIWKDYKQIGIDLPIK